MALAPTLCNFYQKIQVHHLLHRDVREHCKLPHLRYYNIPQWPFLSKYYEAFLPSESLKLVSISCKRDFSICLYGLRKHYLNFGSYLTFESTFNLEKLSFGSYRMDFFLLLTIHLLSYRDLLLFTFCMNFVNVCYFSVFSS